MNGLKSGLGMQKFSDGSIYYGNFYLGYMHGEGVMVQKNNKYISGEMHFDSFNHGLKLYPNKTLVFTRNLVGSVLKKVHHINIENGETQCKDLYTGKLSNEICTAKNTIKTGYVKENLGDDEFYR